MFAFISKTQESEESLQSVKKNQSPTQVSSTQRLVNITFQTTCVLNSFSFLQLGLRKEGDSSINSRKEELEQVSIPGYLSRHGNEEVES